MNDLTILSALPAGWAPGDSFLRRKMPSLFFMSLALRAEAEKGVGQPGPLGPCEARAGRRRCGGGTYSFIVCRLCRFPLRVRYMPRSISVGPPPWGPGGSAPQPASQAAAGSSGAGSAERSFAGIPAGGLGLPGTGRQDSDRRSQEMGGTRTGSGKKNIPPGQP